MTCRATPCRAAARRSRLDSLRAERYRLSAWPVGSGFRTLAGPSQVQLECPRKILAAGPLLLLQSISRVLRDG